MTKPSAHGSQAHVGAVSPVTETDDGGSSPRLQALDGNPQGAVGPLVWQAFRGSVAHLYTVSLLDPSDEARFALNSRTYATPNGILMRCEGTGFIMTREPTPG